MALQRLMRLVDSAATPPSETGARRGALATTDRRHVDQPFGTAHSYALYAVSGARYPVALCPAIRERGPAGWRGKATGTQRLGDRWQQNDARFDAMDAERWVEEGIES